MDCCDGDVVGIVTVPPTRHNYSASKVAELRELVNEKFRTVHDFYMIRDAENDNTEGRGSP